MNLSISSFAAIPSTGGLQPDSLCNDSINISVCDLRKVNAKLVELEYEKNINKHLRSIINNDSIAINSLNNQLSSVRADYSRDIKRVKKERNIAGGIGVVSIILLIISIL